MRPRRFRRLDRVCLNNQLRRRHNWTGERAILLQLPVERDVAQFAEALARWLAEPALDLRRCTAQLDEPQCPSAGTNALTERGQEVVAHRPLGREGDDQTGQPRGECGIDRIQLHPLAQCDERRTAEGKQRCHQIDDRVIVQQPEAGGLRQRAPHRVLARAGRPKSRTTWGGDVMTVVRMMLSALTKV